MATLESRVFYSFINHFVAIDEAQYEVITAVSVWPLWDAVATVALCEFYGLRGAEILGDDAHYH